MPSYKLIYFNVKGRGETVRLCFAAAGIKYEDHRIDHKDWAALKPNTPWGKIPVLEVDGKQIGESLAISRYIAREGGLGGKDSFELALIDSVTDQVSDLREKAGAAYFGPEDKKEAAIKEFKNKILPPIFDNLQRFASDNSAGPGYFVGSKISLADIHFYAVMEELLTVLPDALSKHHTLQAIFEAVDSDDGIAEYIMRRPKKDK